MSFLGTLGDVVAGGLGGAVAGGVIGGIVGAAEGGAGAAAATGAGAGTEAGAVAGAASAGANAGNLAGAQLGGVLGAIIGAVTGRSSFRWRYLQGAEPYYISTVFGNTMPALSNIVITDIAGMNDRPFTIPGLLCVPLGTLIPAFSFTALTAPILLTKYLINLGPAGFFDPINFDTPGKVPYETLTHELTHVWQGHNKAFTYDYVFSSVKNQILHGEAAYAYTAGKQWSDYNSEQQAHIVQDWFAQSKQDVPDDNYAPYRGSANYQYTKLFRYIKYNIRAGNPSAKSPDPDSIVQPGRINSPIPPGLRFTSVTPKMSVYHPK